MDDARLLASEIGERVTERLGTPHHVFDLPTRAPGEVSRAATGIEWSGVVRIVVVAQALGIGRSIVHLGERGVRTALIGAREGAEGDAAALAERVLAPLTGGILDRVAVSALDVGNGLVLGLARAMSVDGSWFRFATYGEWSANPLASGTTVEVGGAQEWPQFARVAQEQVGVTLSVPGAAFGAPRPAWTFTAGADVQAAFGDVVQRVKSAIDARSRWRARPFPLRDAGQRIVAALRAAGVGPGEIEARYAEGSGFPSSWPAAMIWRVDRIGQHPTVQLAESEEGIAISAGRASFSAADRDALEALLPRLVDAVHEAASRLTVDQLVPGQTYRVLLDLPGAPAATILRFERTQHVVYDGFDILHFAVPAEGREVALYAIDPAVEKALPELERYLAPVVAEPE